MKNEFRDKPIAIAENIRIEDDVLKFTIKSLAKTKKEKRELERAVHFLMCPFHF